MHNKFKQTDKEIYEKVLLTRARNSRHVSATRGGIKILEVAAYNENEAIADPLQHDVFGSEVGGPKPTITKEHRESLWELFQNTNTTEQKSESIRSITIEKKTDYASVPILKKIPEERTIHHSSKRSLASAGTLDSALELHKVLHMLHRVHTEATAMSQKSQNLWKDIAISKVSHPRYNGGTDTICKREYWIKSDAEYC
ncbi:protein LAZY 1 isoform X1 [Tanacetum coccineum]